VVCVGLALALGCHGSGSSPSPSPSPTLISISAPELVTAIVDDWSSTHATLRRFRRAGTTWRAVGNPWPGVIGKAGAAWGDGLHGAGAPAGRDGPIKREGDGKAPAGAFAIGAAYGYAAAAPAGSRLPYTPLDARWECVDDPASGQYARIVDRERVVVDWQSSEKMRRDDGLYAWVIDISHNAPRTRDRGSCIFFHVWAGADAPTLGCTAMAEPKLADLVATLDPRAVFVLLTRADYDALAPAWGLPMR
jgi:D-alanyl-D-alanine dipeptidase